MASIIVSPKGSGQSTGNSSARASPRKRVFSSSPISPMNSTSEPSMRRAMDASKYARSAGSILAAILSGIPVRRAIVIARSIPFSRAMRPRKARYRPGASVAACICGGIP